MKRPAETPTLNDLLDARIYRSMAAMHCIGLGTIQAFDEETQLATISLNYKRIVKDSIMAENNIDTKDEIKDYPLLINCPVIFLRGGVAKLTFPVVQGDECIIFFNDRDMDTWLDTGIKINPPNSERIHSLTDAIALVGISSKANPLEDFNTLIASLIDKTGERLAQAGDVKATARSTAPFGWLLCYGQAISRTTYDILFSAIGTTFGTGDGSTTFNLPDLRGRTIVGLDNMGGSQANVLTTAFNTNRNTLGGVVGEESHLLTGLESGIKQHHHNIKIYGYAGGDNGVSHAYTGGANDMNQNTDDTGHTDATNRHQNVQPGMMMNWIIKI